MHTVCTNDINNPYVTGRQADVLEHVSQLCGATEWFDVDHYNEIFDPSDPTQKVDAVAALTKLMALADNNILSVLTNEARATLFELLAERGIKN